MSGWTIRRLEPADLPIFRPLRLRSLREHPEAFGSSFEEEQALDLTHLIGAPPNITLGGFVGQALVGAVAMIVSPKIKLRHKGHVAAMYVNPEARRAGLACGLIQHLIGDARAAGLWTLTLTVTSGNVAARNLYRRTEFSTYGVEPNGLLTNGIAWDVELMALALREPA
jgi:ribosomal protein S18 acetylase RimI-like enzyme